MKRILLSIFVALASQSLIAMEPAEQSTLSQEERDGLGKDLAQALWHAQYAKAIALIELGANVNVRHESYGQIMRCLLNTLNWTRGDSITPEENKVRVEVLKKLIQKGARFGNMLHQCSLELDEPVMQVLLDSGADIYTEGGSLGKPIVWHATNLYPRLKFVEMICQKAITMKPEELSCVKSWLLVCNRLKDPRNHLNPIFTVLRPVIAQVMIDGLAQDARDRLIRAGAQNAAQMIQNGDAQKYGGIQQYLANVLNPEHLRKYVRHHVCEAIRNTPHMIENNQPEVSNNHDNNQ